MCISVISFNGKMNGCSHQTLISADILFGRGNEVATKEILLYMKGDRTKTSLANHFN